MTCAKTTAYFSYPVEKVWEKMTDLTDVSWRSDLATIECISENTFVEHAREGYATRLTTTLTEPLKRWEFDLENSNMSGHWTGIFSESAAGTTVEFIEDITAKKRFLRPVLKFYLKKQQKRYIADLQEGLANEA